MKLHTKFLLIGCSVGMWFMCATLALLMMLVYHDDVKREWAYGPKSKIGTFSAALMTEARKSDWTVISMKDDWKNIFAFEK